MAKKAAEASTPHQVLYRAYRPQSFSEVRGQEQVVSVLESAIKKGAVAHAYLFSGTRGTGKTSVARILAKELGVSDKDLYEIDAASNRGIDDIRALREGVHALPFNSPYKFYIIDEAHMLTKDAWNALLKTIEEPPAHAIFVLCTTERDKVPDTIQSRCEVFSFAQPTQEMLSDVVIDIAKREGYLLEKPAGELVALLAEGSFRDGLSILQKILSGAPDKKVSAEDVEKISSAPRGELVRNILSGLAKKDAAVALESVQKAVGANVDARILAKLLILRMRAVLLLRYAPELYESIAGELTEADAALAKELAKEPAVNSEMLRALLEAHARMAYAAVPFLPLELAIIDSCGGTKTSTS